MSEQTDDKDYETAKETSMDNVLQDFRARLDTMQKVRFTAHSLNNLLTYPLV